MSSRSSLRLADHFRKGGWLPASREVLQKWLADALKECADNASRGTFTLLPVIAEFEAFILNNAEMYMGFHQMFEGATPPFPTDYKKLLLLFNKIIQEAPTYGAIGPPIYMVISQAMDTQGGFTTFLSTELNKQFKRMFAHWADFLNTEHSRYVLNDKEGGWFSEPALIEMQKHFDGLTFDETFECLPYLAHKGFSSWEHFFNRTFRPHVRTLEFPERDDIINGACESVLYNIATAVKERDTFWLKGEPYSLMHMLNHDPDYAEQFVGGTVFQGFLEVTGYHRWHSPVTGTIKKIVQIEGTYFVQSPATLGEPSMLEDSEADVPPFLRSLAFITSLTTRALIFIESSNPLIGLMCFMAIGMTEISTCEVTVQENQPITRGDQLGMFHFGGSSHVLVFRPETNITFFSEYDTPGQHVKVRAAIAGVA
ncbi:phosphatidylserine decarboxylase [Gautieria morchelliformis]|nr:phosphatidylserine decarboxylase [Gautieria morchelliformis]